jgi:hypothetical protein
VRNWLDDRIARLDAGEPADDAESVAELAEVLRTELARPEEAERLLQ